MGFRQIFGGSTPPKIFNGCGFVKDLGAVHPPKCFTDGVPSNIWGVYTPKIFHGWGSVKYLGGLHPQNISRMWFRQIFGGCRPPKYFTDGVPSNIWGVYNPKIFQEWGSVKYLGGLHPQNISRM